MQARGDVWADPGVCNDGEGMCQSPSALLPPALPLSRLESLPCEEDRRTSEASFHTLLAFSSPSPFRSFALSAAACATSSCDQPLT